MDGNLISDHEITDHHKHHPSHHNDTHLHDHHHQHDDAFLHEAQDILIDITGVVIGMQLLDIETTAYIVAPVSAGGGKVHFSHGKVDVPAPATKNIFEKFKIDYIEGPVETELCTPTGAAVLAALDATKITSKPVNYKYQGTSRGTKDLPVPPLSIQIG